MKFMPFDVDPKIIEQFRPNGIILSGGPETVLEETTPRAPECVFELGVPVLGICYGMQTMAAQLGGEVESPAHREFGYAQVRTRKESVLLSGIEDQIQENDALLDVWMSHGDRVNVTTTRIHYHCRNIFIVQLQRWKIQSAIFMEYNFIQRSLILDKANEF